MNTIADRRRAYIEKAYETAEPAPAPPPDADGLAYLQAEIQNWGLNHARLVLGRDLDQANAFFEHFRIDRTPMTWKDGKVDTADWDFIGVPLLMTLLDFGCGERLSRGATANLRDLIVHWQVPRPTTNRDNHEVARWPKIHTENHDIMCLTIGLFREMLAGRDAGRHVRELSKSLAWRFERGWIEWNSPCYQVPYMNPVLLLARHAPDANLRAGARELLNLQFAERALLSVGGYLGGPFSRGYVQHVTSDLVDGFLPVMNLCFGLPDIEPQLTGHCLFPFDTFQPHPVVAGLVADAASRPELIYYGTRRAQEKTREHLRLKVSYYNTPHVSMGALNFKGYISQGRYFSVLFPAEPEKHLRLHLRDSQWASPWDPTVEVGDTWQCGNVTFARGELIEAGGLKGSKTGPWTLYEVGRGLCAHTMAEDDWHVFVVSDLDKFASGRAFLAALQPPRKIDGAGQGDVRLTVPNGDEVALHYTDRLGARQVCLNGVWPEDRTEMLHDCEFLRSVVGTGVVEVRSSAGELALSNAALRANLP